MIKYAAKLPQTSTRTKLKVGDRVTFTNDQGVTFKGHKVVGFDADGEDRFIHIDTDCYWLPKREDQLTLEGAN